MSGVTAKQASLTHYEDLSHTTSRMWCKASYFPLSLFIDVHNRGKKEKKIACYEHWIYIIIKWIFVFSFSWL